ncbi:hypothetical protein F5Y18DRAFT_421882 [Xylariaceae sp. FL1019]|nr:hypothetical protein F5Y18DRAFT_421882 [Xylariaceae sp. FL1019]
MTSHSLLLLYLAVISALSQACRTYEGPRCCGSSTGSKLGCPSTSTCPVLPSQYSRSESTHPPKRSADKDDEVDTIRQNFTQVMGNLNDASAGAIRLMMQLVVSLESLSQKVSMLEAAPPTSISRSAPSEALSTLPGGLYSYSSRLGSSFNNSIGDYPTPTSGLTIRPVPSNRSTSISATPGHHPMSPYSTIEDTITVTVTTHITPVASDRSGSSSATPSRHPMSSDLSTENTTKVTVTTQSTITVTIPADDATLASSSVSGLSSSSHHALSSTAHSLSQSGQSSASKSAQGQNEGAKTDASSETAGATTTLTVYPTVTVFSTVITTLQTSLISRTASAMTNGPSSSHRPLVTLTTTITLEPEFSILSTILTTRKSDGPPYPSSNSRASLAPSESYPIPPPYHNRSSNASFVSSRPSSSFPTMLSSSSTSICSEFLTLMSRSSTESRTVTGISVTGSSVITPPSPGTPSTTSSAMSPSSGAYFSIITPYMSKPSMAKRYVSEDHGQIIDVKVKPVTLRRVTRTTEHTESDQSVAAN